MVLCVIVPNVAPVGAAGTVVTADVVTVPPDLLLFTDAIVNVYDVFSVSPVTV
jgi:hypothetical protein